VRVRLIHSFLHLPPPSDLSSPNPSLPLPTTLFLPDATDPHAAALRIVEFLKEFAARRRSHGDWEAVNDASRRVGRDGEGGCGCGVITPVLTPAEEREIRF
jgi:hypothetical protein